MNKQSSIVQRNMSVLKVLCVAALVMISNQAFAAGVDPGVAICKLFSLLSGKWLFGMGMLAIFGGGAAILFGGEITDGLKKVATIVLVIGLIVASTNIMGMLGLNGSC